jgi:menaquinone-dependent protoporphyrinogen oxidase
MARILVLYATAEGQTARVAAHMAARLRGAGHGVDLQETRPGIPCPELGGYDAIVVGASVHYGHHPGHLRRLLRIQHPALTSRPSAFFSVSLSVQEKYATALLRQVAWRPDRVASFAGALQYSRYGRLKRLLVRAFAAIGGHDTDTSRDYEYTDWGSVGSFADAFASRLRA